MCIIRRRRRRARKPLGIIIIIYVVPIYTCDKRMDRHRHRRGRSGLG